MTATTPRLARLARFGGGGLGAGLLITASLPPFGWWPLGIAGVAVLALVLQGAGGAGTARTRWRWRLLAGGAAGLGLYGPGLWWATEFNAAGYVVLVVTEAAILALVVSAVRPGRVMVALPAALVVAEAVRGRWPFGGLPLAGLDLGQAGGPLVGAARIGGHLLLVGITGLAGVGLATLAARPRPRPRPPRLRAGAACLAVAAAVAGLGGLAPDGVDHGPLVVAAVQGGGVRGVRSVDADPATVLEAQLAESKGLGGAPALVLWPEDVIQIDGPLAGSPQEAIVGAMAHDLHATLVAGVVEDDSSGRSFHNAAVAWSPGGIIVSRYDKVHRVPFGEYVPLRSFFAHLADLSAVPRDAVAGHGPGLLVTPVGRVAVTISYEVFFADRARSGVLAGGELLLVPTNASSYTTSQVPAQELAAARLRAVETGRWVVQAAPTGYSAVVDQRGNVHARGPLGGPAALDVAVGKRGGRTLAVRLGDEPVALLAGLLLALAALVPRRRG